MWALKGCAIICSTIKHYWFSEWIPWNSYLRNLCYQEDLRGGIYYWLNLILFISHRNLWKGKQSPTTLQKTWSMVINPWHIFSQMNPFWILKRIILYLAYVFDGVVKAHWNGFGAIPISPTGEHFLMAAKLRFPYTTNMAEYEAYIAGLKAALDMNVKDLKVYVDSILIIRQSTWKCKVKSPELVKYKGYLKLSSMSLSAPCHSIICLVWEVNLLIVWQLYLPCPIVVETNDQLIYWHNVEAEPDSNPWYHDIRMFLKDDIYPKSTNSMVRRTFRKLVCHFFLNGEVLYKDHMMVYYYDVQILLRQLIYRVKSMKGSIDP